MMTVRNVMTAVIVALVLAACATTSGGFTRAQQRALVAEGFVQTEAGWELSMADRLLFDLDSVELKSGMHTSVARVADSLLRVGIDAARVEGHTDSTGAPDYNARLSEQRATAVAAAMQGRGFSAATLLLHGWGETRPIADNGSDDGRAQNRRVVIIVTAR